MIQFKLFRMRTFKKMSGHVGCGMLHRTPEYANTIAMYGEWLCTTVNRVQCALVIHST